MKNLTDTMVRHAQSFYAELEKQANDEEVHGGTLKVFRGHLTRVYDGMNISRSYYTPIITLLRENECVSFLQRGSRSVESVVVLHQEPTTEGMSLPPLTGRSQAAMVQARLEALEKTTGGLDIVKALDNHEKRLKKLESRRGGRVSGT